MSVLLFEKRGHVAWLTLNRPEHHNLLNGDLFIALADAWEEVRNDDQIRTAPPELSGEFEAYST